MPARTGRRIVSRLLLTVAAAALAAGCGGSVIGASGTHGGHGAGDSAVDASPTCRAGDGEVHAGHGMNAADFAGRNVRCAVFDTARLGRPDFSGADLSRASFDASTVTEPDFTGATLVGATFTGAELDRPVFVDADLRGADLREATVRDPDWTGATCPDGTTAGEATGCAGHLDPAVAGQ